MEIVFFTVIALAICIALGRWVLLRWETRNSVNLRRHREQQALRDYPRISRLTDEELRAGAR